VDISVRGLTAGLRRHSQQVAVDDLGLPEEEHCFTRPVQVDYTVEKTGGQVIVRGTVSTTADMTCSRCLAPVQVDISERFTLLVRFDAGEARGGKAVGGTSAGEGDEDVKFVAPDQDRIDITDDLRQALLLALPVKPLCDENCRGLCPQCGTNLNHASCDCRPCKTDPRWAGLEKALKTSQGENRGRTEKKDLQIQKG
jgi:uncharacterized protein